MNDPSKPSEWDRWLQSDSILPNMAVILIDKNRKKLRNAIVFTWASHWETLRLSRELSGESFISVERHWVCHETKIFAFVSSYLTKLSYFGS